MGMHADELNLIAFSDFIDECPIKDFYPVAYYDKNLDCINIQTKDCSFVEKTRNSFFNLLYENHSEGKPLIGFSIQNARSLFKEQRMNDVYAGSYCLKQVLDIMIKKYPDQANHEVCLFLQEEFKDFLELEIANIQDIFV